MGLLSELKRRNVHRMMALYIAAAWLIMQVTDVLEDLLELPPEIGQYVVILLAVGFPVALVLSWFYELTPEGLMLETNVAVGNSIRHATGRRLDFVIITVLSAAVLMFAWDKWVRADPPFPTAPNTSIAVLPLKSLSDDPEQAYFAEQVTDILITELTRVAGLEVQIRRYPVPLDGEESSLIEIAEKLQVDLLVNGSTRWDDEAVHLNLHLINADTGRYVWAEQYRRNTSDIFGLLGEVANAIAGVVGMETEPTTARRPVVPEAFRYWVIGIQHLLSLDADANDRALRAFEYAIEKDPTFALAWAGVAQVHVRRAGWHGDRRPTDFDVIRAARDAAQEAIRLDTDLAEAHFVLAQLHRLEWDWESAERAFIKGSEADPSSSVGLIAYANFLASMGRFEESAKVALRAVEIDPLTPNTYVEFGGALGLAGDHEQAIAKFEHALELQPDFFQARWILAETYVGLGDFDKAAPILNSFRQNYESLPTTTIIGRLGFSFAWIGQTADAERILTHLLNRAEQEYIPGCALAYVYVGLGESDLALDWLELAYEQRDVTLVWLRADPIFAPLYGNPRYEALVSRMNFPPRNRSED